jgi:predicted aconitase
MAENTVTDTDKAMLEAIRNDPSIGRGSCAMVDECMTDSEVLEDLRSAGITDSDKAVAYFKGTENLWREKADEVIAAGGDDPFRWGQV